MHKNKYFTVDAYLDETGVFREAAICRDGAEWQEFTVGNSVVEKHGGSYLVPTYPVELHCHGVGQFNFSRLDELDLESINEVAAREQVLLVPSIFLPHNQLDVFVDMMKSYAKDRTAGKLSHIAGFSLEGPLLASFGGTPDKGTWLPTKREWEKIVSCAGYGLKYSVLSPDAMMEGSYLADQYTSSHPDIVWITEAMMEAGLRPAIGHFQKRNPVGSVNCIKTILETAQRYSNYDRHSVITDHLFNDMPLKFKHAWRNKQEREKRASELAILELNSWSWDDLEQQIGDVPAFLMKAARDGWLTLMMNFDGEHVDLEISRRVVEMVGAQSVCSMTDRIDVPYLGEQPLSRREDSSLWYQSKGVVAAGTTTIDRQMENMRSLGLSESDIWQMAGFVPHHVIGLHVAESGFGQARPFSLMTEDRQRLGFLDRVNDGYIVK